MEKILVWDWPVRIGHWLMAAGFALAWLTADSESFRLVHVIAGGVVLGVASFRLLWGVVGTRHARFSAFVRGPHAVRRYISSLLRLDPEHHVGHNPAGGWAIVGLLGLALATPICGWAIYNELGPEWLEDLHEGLAVLMLLLVVVHLTGVLSGSLLHEENLVLAMLDGRKRGAPGDAISRPRALAAVLLLAWIVAVCLTLRYC